jgi:hypothetical protein
MEFETQPQQEIYQKIEPWMKDLFGIFYNKREDTPYFGVNIGSAFVHVGVQPWGADNVTITSRAYVAVNVEIKPDLMLFLLRENDKMRFGAFGLDDDNDIFFEHTIPGLTCDVEMLKSSILAVGYAVDQYDDQIVSRWGGVPASEMQVEG